MCMAKSEEDLPKAAKEAALACAHDALPVTEVGLGGGGRGAVKCLVLTTFCLQAVSVMHSVLRRCIDGGWLSMVGCLIQALRVPIVPVDDLCDFFKSPEVSYLNFSHFMGFLRESAARNVVVRYCRRGRGRVHAG